MQRLGGGTGKLMLKHADMEAPNEPLLAPGTARKYTSAPALIAGRVSAIWLWRYTLDPIIPLDG